jgi:hypothetical protein
LINPISYDAVYEPETLSFLDEVKNKFEKLKLEISCTSTPQINEPAKKMEPFDIAELESLGSSAISSMESPSTPRAK